MFCIPLKSGKKRRGRDHRDGFAMPYRMPQSSNISEAPGWPLERRPELSAYIARIVSLWSRIEERLGSMIVRLLGAEMQIGMTMLQAQPSTADRMAMLRTLARERLNKDMQKRLDELLIRYSDAEWKREKVIRGHWYLSDDHPDALVWADPADKYLSEGEFWAGFKASGGFGEQVKFAREYARPRPEYWLFDKAEFESILLEFRELGLDLTDFIMELSDAENSQRDRASLAQG